MHSAIKIGKHFVDRANENKIFDMTPLKLQKIVYIAHGWMLGLYDEPLFSEDVEAWQYGPVVPELYRETKRYKGINISTLDDERYEVTLKPHEESIVKQTFDKYSVLSGPQLVTLTHKSGTPWHDVTKGGETVYAGLLIPNEMIRDYYWRLKNA